MQTRELYHFHILNDYSDKWKVGEKLIFNKEQTNYYYKSIIELKTNNQLNSDTEALTSKIEEFLNMGTRLLHAVPQLKNISQENEQYREYIAGFDNILKTCSRTLRYYVTYIRELTFEEARLNINPDLPSRKNCLWVCDEDHVEMWKKIWTPNKKYKLFKMKLEGNFHEADSRMINDTAWKIENFEKNSKCYWKNETFLSGPKQPEILFEGNAIILEEL